MTFDKSSIPEIAWRKLGDWGSITLPELGTFVLQVQNAQMDPYRNTITAPCKKIAYLQDTSSHSRHSIFNAQEARDWINIHYSEFISSFKSEIAENQFYTLPHIGSLTQTSYGLEFSPDPHSVLTQRGKELQQIAFVPIMRTYEKPEEDAPLIPYQKRKSKPILSRLTWVILFVLLNSVLIIWLADRNKDRAEMDSLSVNLPDSRLNIKPSADAPYPDLPEIATDSLSESVQDSLIATPPEEVISEIDKPEMLKADKNEPKIALPETAVKESKSGLKEIKSGSKSLITTADHKCAIIVGSFREKSNVDKMVERIKKEALEPYTEKGNKLTKVGILTSCEYPQPALELAQAKFHPDAWIYTLPE